jgi:DNA-binding winged helix-turn-helix (wHTH) protein/Tol biopolymer transport system component
MREPGEFPIEHYEFGPFELDCRTRQLRRGHEPIALTPKAFDMLRVLVLSGGRVVEKNELLQLVWPDSFVGEDNLTQNIATLRRALGDSPDRPRYIATVPRHGYRFIATVRGRTAEPFVEQQGTPLPQTVSGWRWLAITVSCVSVVAMAALAMDLWRSGGPPIVPVMRFTVGAPEGTTFSPSASLLAVSPDGRFIAFVAARSGEPSRLWIRPLNSVTPRELTGTENALGPFWSPDSRYLAFFANGQLKTVSLLGEPPVALCTVDGQTAPSGTWNEDGVILFTGGPGGVYRTSARGGDVRRVTTIDARAGEVAHVLPQFLPGGKRFVYTVRADAEGSVASWIASASLDSKVQQRLFSASSQAIFAGPDYLLFIRDGMLLAQHFDPAAQQLHDEPSTIPDADRVAWNPATPRGMFSASQTGVLAYRAAVNPELGWYDRGGRPISWIASSSQHHNPALSQDGRRLAVSRHDTAHPIFSLWILDLDHGGLASRLTSHPVWESCAVWSSDDSTIVYERGVPEDGEIYEKTGNHDERVLPYHPRGCPLAVTPDGRFLLYSATRGHGSPGDGLWLMSLTGQEEPKRLTGAWPLRPQASISPDGRWLAYVSDVSGRNEIYVRSFPNGTDVRQVSTQGGVEPQWRADGRELFFLAADKNLTAAPVTPERVLNIGPPTVLFPTDMDPTGRLGIVGRNQYVVSRDGQRFLINQTRPGAAPAPINVVVNWPAALYK